MDTRFICNKEIESQRLLNVYWSLGHNIYSEHGFFVLPYKVPKNTHVIYLPPLKRVKDVKNIVKILSLHDRINIPTENQELIKLAGKIEIKINSNEKINKENITSVEKEWKNIEGAFEDYFVSLFPQFRKSQLKLNIYWTQYGSLMSYNRPLVQGLLNQATIFLRDDMGVPQIVEGFLSSMLSQRFEEREMSWLQRETVVDFLGLDTNLKHLIQNFSPTVLYDKNQSTGLDAKIINDSAKYLRSLDLEYQTLISVKNEIVYVHGKPSKIPFGGIERKFLELLINKPSEPVSYFDIADQIWPNNEDSFSLWALSQLAYKIKNKLRKNNLNPEIIRNVRGIGYIFVPQS